jgi:hypothetical protein
MLPPGEGEPVSGLGDAGGGAGIGPRPGFGAPSRGGLGSGSGVRGGAGALGEGEPGVGRMPGGAAGAGGAAEEGPGSRSGVGPGSAAAEEEALAAERGVAGPTAASSRAMGPMMGGRGAKGGEDAEHKRRYGLDEDGDVRFGSEEKVAPQVIGESATQRDARHEAETGRHHRQD